MQLSVVYPATIALLTHPSKSVQICIVTCMWTAVNAKRVPRFPKSRSESDFAICLCPPCPSAKAQRHIDYPRPIPHCTRQHLIARERRRRAVVSFASFIFPAATIATPLRYRVSEMTMILGTVTLNGPICDWSMNAPTYQLCTAIDNI